MFGHIAQMPQILRSAGFTHAVVWRGVPSAVTGSGFLWEAPDGSTVRAEYLPTGYSNGATLPDDAKALVERLEGHLEEVGDLVGDELLCMNGSDHLFPQPWLGRVVAEANQIQDGLDLRVTSLPEYLATAPTDGLPRWKGELRSGFRADMLMGVTSNRVDVKRLGESAVRELERRAEPLAALFQEPSEWPQRQLELAWKEIVRNSAHDSICACSVDDVVDAVLHRYAEARTIATGLAGAGHRVAGAFAGRARLLCAQSSPPSPFGGGRAGGRCGRAAHRGRAGAVGAHRTIRADRYSTPTPSVPSSRCCRARRSITTRGCTTSSSRRAMRVSTSRSRWAPRNAMTHPSPRPSGTSMRCSRRGPTP